LQPPKIGKANSVHLNGVEDEVAQSGAAHVLLLTRVRARVVGDREAANVNGPRP
jgi:hypothetical protein